MKKVIVVMLAFLALACGSGKDKSAKAPLFTILKQAGTGGAQIEFYEIITDGKEFELLKNDPELKRKINKSNIDQSTFVVLSAGEKPSGGYGITVVDVKESEKEVEVYVKKTEPSANAYLTMAITYPICIVQINSKKPLVFKDVE
ncbi:protease complex subunit PrcB family protein [Flavobacterium sp.]|uniref:protease complex subunit PrcB family protein n=1 Tax=Flavobacterium sp. TaxID=239 RepID=UPI00262528ED|nr:protease complex subunit PrcB family protein [Flavobacterium sp.]